MTSNSQPGSWLALVIVGGAVILAITLATLEIYSEPPHKIHAESIGTSSVFEADVHLAHEQCDSARAELNHLLIEQRNLAATLIHPGLEPPWYHPVDHMTWSGRKKTFEQGLETIQAARERVIVAQQKLESLTRLLTDRERLLELAHGAGQNRTPNDIPGPVRDATRWLWNVVIRPLLHWLLIVALLFFALNRLLRLALIQGWLGDERL